MNAVKKDDPCPCCSGKKFAQCCQPLLIGAAHASNAQALMRSRYTAYTLNDEAYVQKTWHPATRPANLNLQPCKWIGLTVVAHDENEHTATVEFVAKYKINGRAEKMHELSRFVFEGERWLYVDGDVSN